jgi:hypothetical protein
MRALKTLRLATFAATLLLALPVVATEPARQQKAGQETPSIQLETEQLLFELDALSHQVAAATLPIHLADGPSDDSVRPETEPTCYLVSSYCSTCANYKVRTCNRYRCWVGPDDYYTTSCGSCYPYC